VQVPPHTPCARAVLREDGKEELRSIVSAMPSRPPSSPRPDRPSGTGACTVGAILYLANPDASAPHSRRRSTSSATC
jgi:hypothetical protein